MRKAQSWVAGAALACVVCTASGQSFSELQNAKAALGVATVRLTPVRESALRDVAIRLGFQWGLGDRSREIIQITEAQSTKLDRHYEFGALMIGVGFLPPVISEVRDSVSIEGTTMRFGKVVYHIDEAPRPVRVVPTWRDWLYVGLDGELRPPVPTEEGLLPRDDLEQAYWKAQLSQAYNQGREQADEVFELNRAQLKRTYLGMRRYFDLHKRGLVTAPKIVTASSIISRTDPNTVVIGDVVFSVNVEAQFNEKPEAWVPLSD